MNRLPERLQSLADVFTVLERGPGADLGGFDLGYLLRVGREKLSRTLQVELNALDHFRVAQFEEMIPRLVKMPERDLAHHLQQVRIVADRRERLLTDVEIDRRFPVLRAQPHEPLSRGDEIGEVVDDADFLID